MADPADTPQKALNVVRLALITGSLMFGPIAWVVARMNATTVFAGVERYVWVGLTVLFLGLFGGILAVRSRWRAADTFEEKRSANVLGWALAQLAALLGGLYLVVGGTPLFFGAGVALQLVTSYVLLPVPET